MLTNTLYCKQCDKRILAYNWTRHHDSMSHKINAFSKRCRENPKKLHCRFCDKWMYYSNMKRHEKSKTHKKKDYLSNLKELPVDVLRLITYYRHYISASELLISSFQELDNKVFAVTDAKQTKSFDLRMCKHTSPNKDCTLMYGFTFANDMDELIHTELVYNMKFSPIMLSTPSVEQYRINHHIPPMVFTYDPDTNILSIDKSFLDINTLTPVIANNTHKYPDSLQRLVILNMLFNDN